MRINHDGYPEGTDLKHFDDSPVRPIETARGVPVVSFDFYCPHCEQLLCIDSDEFSDGPVLEEDCYHCGSMLLLEIAEDQYEFVTGGG